MTGSALDDASAADVQATFCATLVDEWCRRGVEHAVVAPGSRSTPMALALAESDAISVHVVHDERSAAFVALGLGLGGTPAVLICTSGTAAANFFPAVVEAGLSAVPMVVVTADRPEELRGVGAPQTIDQIELYGNHVRWFHDPDVPTAAGSDEWRPLARRALRYSADGPIQLNLPFREPLLGTVRELPATSEDDTDPIVVPTRDEVPSAVASAHGLIVVGGRSGVEPAAVAALAHQTGWPVLADPLSRMRHLDGTIVHTESLLRVPAFASAHHPSVIVRVGRPATSKTLAQWIDQRVAHREATLIQVGGPGRIDPGHNVAAVCDIDAIIREATCPPDPQWRESWDRADRAAASAIEHVLDAPLLTEPSAARVVADHLPDGVELMVASSMPVRDLEWFGGRTARAQCNRGANGIDGVTSTGLGLALAGSPTVVLIGDLAFVHDINALVGLAARRADLRVVVIDNDGGGIFSFLPQADALSVERFEQLFGTPLGVDVLGLAAAHGIPAREVTTGDELAAQLGEPGPWVARVASNRRANVEHHAALHAAVAAVVA